jgi:hypothetical protein
MNDQKGSMLLVKLSFFQPESDWKSPAISEKYQEIKLPAGTVCVAHYSAERFIPVFVRYKSTGLKESIVESRDSIYQGV